jgi:ribosomal protein S18 acetylase RimI-like enzyme
LFEVHSLRWVTARNSSDELVGLVIVISDGHLHGWLQDLMVASDCRHQRIESDMVQEVEARCSQAGFEWLHGDFEEPLSNFYLTLTADFEEVRPDY